MFQVTNMDGKAVAIAPAHVVSITNNGASGSTFLLSDGSTVSVGNVYDFNALVLYASGYVAPVPTTGNGGGNAEP